MLSLIVNPSAGGGRAGRALPGVQQALRDHGLEHHVERTRSLEHARELARQATAANETAVAFGGDGLVGAVAGALHEVDGVLGVLPGGRGNDFARVLGIPLEPEAACAVLAKRRTSPASTSARSPARRSSGSPAAASIPRPTASPTRQGSYAGTSSTPTARCARLPAGVRPPSRS